MESGDGQVALVHIVAVDGPETNVCPIAVVALDSVVA